MAQNIRHTYQETCRNPNKGSWGLAGRYQNKNINMNVTLFYCHMDERRVPTSLFIWVDAWKVSFKRECHVRVRGRSDQTVYLKK